MIKHFLEWGNQDISLGDFIGLAFVSMLMTIKRFYLIEVIQDN
jgi:hypothetical protein